MQGGIQLKLLIGPEPQPASASSEMVEALASAQVQVAAGGSQAGFELTFDLAPRSPLLTQFLLSGGGSVKSVRVVLVVQIGGHVEPVIDGIVMNVAMQSGEGGMIKLVVKGKDLTALMDEKDRTVTYGGMSRKDRVEKVLKGYEVFGVKPMVIKSIIEDIPLLSDRIPQQFGTDYAYLTDLAQEAGHVFYLDPGPTPANSTAYWGPENRVGEPQPALSVNMDAVTNVEHLTFNFDRERTTTPNAYYQEPSSKEAFDAGSSDTSRLNPPLGQATTLPARTRNLCNSAHLSQQSARMAALAYTGQNSDSVFGTGSLEVVRYGRLLKSRQLVGVRGAGLPFDGLYYVTSVTHDIKRGVYKQSFTLARNGLLSTVATVRI